MKNYDFRIVKWDIGVDHPIEPSEPLPSMPEDMEPGCLLVLTGRAPIWRYCMALHQAHGSPAGGIATYDPRLGGYVVVASHRPIWRDGDVVVLQKD